MWGLGSGVWGLLFGVHVVSFFIFLVKSVEFYGVNGLVSRG